MKIGTIVEYIDQQKMITALVVEEKKERLRLLTENGREVNLSAARLSHISSNPAEALLSRDQQIRLLKETAENRKMLARKVDLEELWEVLQEENEWQDLDTLTSLCFPENPGPDEESALIRAMFADKLYFKFGPSRFFPHRPEQVEQFKKQLLEAEKRKKLIDDGVLWLKKNLDTSDPVLTEEAKPIAKLLEEYLIFEEEAPGMEILRQVFAGLGGNPGEKLFTLFVRLGIFRPHENLLLKKFGVETEFDSEIMKAVERLQQSPRNFLDDSIRRDLTHLRLITIDGPSTLDYDDALSIEVESDFQIVGVHIVDVAHYVGAESSLDVCAMARGSSIYLPDGRIPMLPPAMSEDLCSLRGGELRPAISVFLKITDYARVVDYEIVPSIICVRDQLTYNDANRLVDEDRDLANLDRIARNFRAQRLLAGAVQITLPEVNVRVDEESGEIILSRIDRESSSRLLVAEMMIMANALMADCLKKNGVPAIFRSQSEPKNRLYKGDEGTLFQNLMQRRHLNRVVLGTSPEPHAGTGFPCYVMATSPIRRYWDLVTQRQLRAILGLEETKDEQAIQNLLARLEEPMAAAGKLQFLRKRYWLFKYLEGRIGKKERAMVLEERRNSYQILLLDYMLEWMLPVSAGIRIKPESEIEVMVQHANARKDQLSLYLA